MTVSESKTSIHRWLRWGLEKGPRVKPRVSVSGCLLYSATFVFSFQPCYTLILWWYLGPALKKRKVDLLNFGDFFLFGFEVIIITIFEFQGFQIFWLWDQFVPVYFTFLQGFSIFLILLCQLFLFSPSHLWIRLDI